MGSVVLPSGDAAQTRSTLELRECDVRLNRADVGRLPASLRVSCKAQARASMKLFHQTKVTNGNMAL
jgi:hypothetical protein